MLPINRWGLPVLFAALVVVASLAGAAAQVDVVPATAGRHALVIGNASYKNVADLRNAHNDAELIADTLRALDFDVRVAIDADYVTMNRTVLAYAQELTPGSVSIVYYAGHGVQVDGENYLVPVDAAPETPSDLPFVSLSANDLLRMFKDRETIANIFIFDACRNNPFEDGRYRSLAGGTSRGLAPIEVAFTGNLIAFSTAPGRVALDGDGSNSPYSRALADSLRKPGLGIESVFKLTRSEVIGATDFKQVPWENSSLTRDLFLLPEASTGKEITECDILAGHPSDPERIHPGIDYALMKPAPAIRACRADLAADPQNPRLMTNLARALDKAGEFAEALELNKAAADAGYLGAYHNLGNHYKKGNGVPRDPDEAYEYFLYAAERGHREDAYNVGVMAFQGTPKRPKDYDAALMWFNRAAEQDYPTAFDKLGLMYRGGLGVEKDLAKAAEYFARGAELGDPSALVNLATAYRKGEGVAQDNAEAFEYYRRAAQLRRRAAYTNLGDMYRRGTAPQPSTEEAAFWYGLAARAGHASSQELYEEMSSQLSDETVRSVERRIQEWLLGDFG
ncbi:caspase family protein [Acuticoccus mangrovi]|uniref:Caspase family protein n=1 Tax=Acuticoccus mangrovi TaxID=2796142 RepID=A0A934ISF2_9HYPH|nr:caspase family protein [Acuticoccus mangrovi]MBJ3777352.1 caspase family protein [Acuticoccus mangrovi]